tara:strand:- start:31 stop:483 length:453 start_codon:yes stop_codon:yes gene_type:complete
MRIKKPKKGFRKLTKAKARLIAHLIGDGAHYKTKHDYVLKYEVRDEESLQQFNDDIISVYGLKPSWEWNKSGITGVPIKFVRLRAKLAFEDLLRYSTYYSKDWELKPLMLNASIQIKNKSCYLTKRIPSIDAPTYKVPVSISTCIRLARS